MTNLAVLAVIGKGRQVRFSTPQVVAVLLCLTMCGIVSASETTASAALSAAYSNRAEYLQLENDFFDKETEGMSRLQACYDFIQLWILPGTQWRTDAENAYDVAMTKYNYYLNIGYQIVQNEGFQGEDFLTTAEYYWGAELYDACENYANQAAFQFDQGHDEFITLNFDHWIPDYGVDHRIGQCEGICTH